MIEDIKKYGLAEAIRQGFKRRAEARKPPPTHDEQIRKAISDIEQFSRHRNERSPWTVGRYVVEQRQDYYEGTSSYFYSASFNGTEIWCGTYYGPYNPFHGRWLISGPWVEDLLNVLLCEVAFLKRDLAQHKEIEDRRQAEDLEREEKAARARHQALIDQFNSGE